jgi:hypothetical protein
VILPFLNKNLTISKPLVILMETNKSMNVNYITVSSKEKSKTDNKTVHGMPYQSVNVHSSHQLVMVLCLVTIFTVMSKL